MIIDTELPITLTICQGSLQIPSDARVELSETRVKIKSLSKCQEEERKEKERIALEEKEKIALEEKEKELRGKILERELKNKEEESKTLEDEEYKTFEEAYGIMKKQPVSMWFNTPQTLLSQSRKELHNAAKEIWDEVKADALIYEREFRSVIN
jgi:hypothetical protein